MDIKNLNLETLEQRISQNKARVNRLKTQDTQRLLKPTNSYRYSDPSRISRFN